MDDLENWAKEEELALLQPRPELTLPEVRERELKSEAISASRRSLEMSGKIATERMIKPFTGEGDIQAWLAKVELVAKLTDIKHVECLIPLYLEGGALAVYMEMPAAHQTDLKLLKDGLLKAFSDSQFVAYSKLKGARWTGEPVDVFSNSVKKLAKECGLEGKGLEQVAKLAFVTGFPDSVGVELQQIQGIEEMDVSDIIVRARVLAGNHGAGAQSVVAAPAVGPVSAKSGQTGSFRGASTMSCYSCNGPHLVRFCPDRKRPDIKCYKCNGPHILRFCPQLKPGGEQAASCARGGPLRTVASRALDVPVIEVEVNSNKVRALVDTGCTSSMVTHRVARATQGESVMVAFDGRKVKCKGTATVSVNVGGERMQLLVTVVESVVGGVDMVLGMDVISRLGGVRVREGTVCFGEKVCAVVADGRQPDIVDTDFEAYYEGGVWTVRYLWNEKGAPTLRNPVSEYPHKLKDQKKQQYEAEVERWIEDGVLKPWSGEVGGILPLMAVEQATKGKIRPVLDFRELNESVRCHTGDEVIDVCSEKMREWRQTEGEAEIVDLRAAYLQIRVSEELWKHQLVKYKGQVYCLTRLGFGLNSAPRVMSKILKSVLSKSDDVKAATSSYIDDIHVDVTKVKAERVIEHLKNFGLEAKPAEKLENGSALGLKLSSSDGKLMFSRANEIPDVSDRMTRRELFSVCGKLIGHYPRVGWLRVACSYAKRHAGGVRWEDDVGDAARVRIKEMVEEVRKNDPVKGEWKVPRSETGTVWCDASDLALGVVMEINGVEVEDAAWLRKSDDHHHINVAELEAVIKGINLCVKWGVIDIIVKTDSATVRGWLELTMSEERRVKTTGAAELLIKRRLGILKELIRELGLTVTVDLVKSEGNKADKMTRVWKRWLVEKKPEVAAAAFDEVRAMHEQHHMGVERSWFLAKNLGGEVNKDLIKRVVSECEKCQSIDPAPVSHVPGELGVSETWTRIAIDVTHYRGLPYLSMVDCGPGRFMLWRPMKGETAAEVCAEVNEVFLERGAVKELLMDNARAFRSEEMRCLLKRWGVSPCFRAAYRPSGNGIVERSHRTIKTMAERAGTSPMEAVYWYNIVPRDGQREESIPQRSVYAYDWRRGEQESEEEAVEPESSVEVGDEVWVKPGNVRCTSQWGRGRITGLTSANNVDVDGMPRHILDVRRLVLREEEEVAPENEQNETEVASGEGEEEPAGERRYPSRTRTVPARFDDYHL